MGMIMMRTLRYGLSIALPGVMMGLLIVGCGKKEDVDPVVELKNRIPAIEKAINTRDLEALADMGTDFFDPEPFLNDLYSHGVRGDVTLRFQRVRMFPDEAELTLIAHFGRNSSGGIKELMFGLKGEDYKINTYTLRDRSIPPPINNDAMEEPREDTATAADPS
ncbi:MAG: hypothetical protein Kow0074_19890 [Candidatus Zixiibacteriota bacterium]